MDFLNDYGEESSEEQQNDVISSEKTQGQLDSGTKKSLNDDNKEGNDTPEYEDFNVDYHHEGNEEVHGNSDSSDNSDDSDDEFGPKPVSIETSNNDVADTADNSVGEIKSTEERFDDYVAKYKIPISCEAHIGGHSRAVTSLSIEPSGNRFVTGSMDYSVKLYDFGGMDNRHRAFSTIEAQDGHPVMSIAHSPNGDRFIVGTASSQPKVYDREGHVIISFVKGDMYLRDLAHTKGHTMAVTCVQWHPTEKNLVLTSSLDGTVRLWDLLGEASFGNLNNLHVLKPSQDKSIVSAMSTAHSHGSSGGANGAIVRTGVTSCVFTPNSGNRIYAGLSNGHIVSWQLQSATSAQRRFYYSPMPSVLSDPFESSASSSLEVNQSRAVLSLTISSNEELMAARYAHGVVLIWDLKNKRVVQRCLHLEDGSYTTANVAFSPDGLRFACSSLLPAEDQAETNSEPPQQDLSKDSSEKKRKPLWGKPRLLFFDSIATSKGKEVTSVSDAVVSDKILRNGALPALAITIGEVGQVGIFCKWHRSTNQIFVTMSHGATKVFFDPKMVPGDNPRKGAVLSSQRAPKRLKDPSDFAIVGEIINPLALPLYRKDNHPSSQRKRKVQDLKDPYIAKIPEKPVKQGPGSRPNNSFFFTNYVMDNQSGKQKPDIRSEDPREALLKYAEAAKDDPRFLGRAYAASQPKPVLAETTFEEEQEQFKKRQKTL